MDERTIGLILRTRPLTETSLIVQWLTRDFGRLSTVAKGARRPKSPFAGKLDLFYLAELSFQQSRRSELHTLREVKIVKLHPSLRTDLGRLQQACYFAQLIEQTTETGTALPEVFALFEQVLEALCASPARLLTVYGFEMKVLSELGLQPKLEETQLTPGARQLLESLTEGDWPMISRLRASSAQSHELDEFLREFLLYHSGRVPKSREPAVRAGRVADEGFVAAKAQPLNPPPDP